MHKQFRMYWKQVEIWCQWTLNINQNEVLTCSKHLRQDAAIKSGIDLIRRFTGPVFCVQKTRMFRISQKIIGDALAATSDRDMQRVVASLKVKDRQISTLTKRI